MCCVKFQLKIESQKDDDNGVFPESISQHIVGKLKSPQSIHGVLAERISEKKDSRDSK